MTKGKDNFELSEFVLIVFAIGVSNRWFVFVVEVNILPVSIHPSSEFYILGREQAEKFNFRALVSFGRVFEVSVD